MAISRGPGGSVSRGPSAAVAATQRVNTSRTSRSADAALARPVRAHYDLLGFPHLDEEPDEDVERTDDEPGASPEAEEWTSETGETGMHGEAVEPHPEAGSLADILNPFDWESNEQHT